MEILQKILDLLQYNPKEPLLFNTGLFLFLFLFLALIYCALKNKLTARLIFVTLFSYYFYYKSSGLYFCLLAIVTVSDWIIGKRIAQTHEPEETDGGEPQNGRSRQARLWLILSIVIDLGLLAFFKYTNFFAGMIAQMIGENFQPWDIFLPAGISFFTFKSISYTVDVYRGKMKPVNSLIDYAFYVSFFPVLLAGPIVRATDFIPQIRKPLSISKHMLAFGAYLIVIGLFKKMVISDYISVNFVSRVFDNPTLFSGGEILMALYGYSIQLYCDFSGYSDMAIGISALLGFNIPANFNAPYKADSLSDFWRRWHISLSSWIRDYIYISLGGNRKGKVRMYMNQMIAMTLCGLWHGASLNFVLWGTLHGLGVCIHKFFSQTIMHHDRHYHPSGLRRFFSVIITFHIVTFLWIFFRSQDFNAAALLIKQLFTKFDITLFPAIVAAYKFVIALIVFALITHWLPDTWQEKIIKLFEKGGVVVCALAITFVIYLAMQVKSSDIQPFIYLQF